MQNARTDYSSYYLWRGLQVVELRGKETRRAAWLLLGGGSTRQWPLIIKWLFFGSEQLKITTSNILDFGIFVIDCQSVVLDELKVCW